MSKKSTKKAKSGKKAQGASIIDKFAAKKGGKIQAQPVATGANAAEASAKDTTTPTKRDTGDGGATGEKRLGILGAAVRVLEEHKGPDTLNCMQMVEQMTTKGYWAPRRGGKTPASTLYAAILREIKDKGKDSRFTKVDRGRFTLNKTK